MGEIHTSNKYYYINGRERESECESEREGLGLRLREKELGELAIYWTLVLSCCRCYSLSLLLFPPPSLLLAIRSTLSAVLLSLPEVFQGEGLR